MSDQAPPCIHYSKKLQKRACENALLLLSIVVDFPWDKDEIIFLYHFFEKKLKEIEGE